MSAYRGAVVEDLQLSPALVLSSDTTVDVALRMAFEREFSLQGWLSAQALQDQVNSQRISETDSLFSILDPSRSKHSSSVSEAAGEQNNATSSVKTPPSSSSSTAPVTKFRKEGGYKVITPDTPLEELESFFTQGQSKGITFALVTDQERKFVLGVVTPDDLLKFISRREPNYKPTFSSTTLTTAS